MRRVSLVVGLALLVGGIVRGLGGPRLTMVNTGLRIEYPWVQGLALLGASLGLALWAWALPRRWMRWISAATAAAVLVGGLGRSVYRVDAGDSDIADRRLFGSTRIVWKDVRRVDAGPALVLLWGPADSQVRVETAGLAPEQRAVLERAISRHVREAQEKAQPPRSGRP